MEYLPAPVSIPAGAIALGIVATDPEVVQCARGCACQRPFHLVFEQPALHHRQQVLGLIEAHRPKVLLLELKSLDGERSSLLEQVRVLVPDCQIIAIGATSATEELMLALRAGCNDYAWPPLDVSLRAALTRAAAALEQDAPGASVNSTVLGFLSAKGGCGSTTLACHAAVELRRQLKDKVLLLDLDFSAGLIGFLMRVTKARSFLDAANNTHRLDGSFWDALVSDVNGLHVLPAPLQAMDTPPLPARAIAQIFRLIRTRYRLIIADLGRGVGPFVEPLFDAMDRVFVVATPDPGSLAQARQITQYFEETRNPRVPVKVLLNRVPRGRQTGAAIAAAAGLPVDCMVSSDYRALYEAVTEGTLVPAKSRLGREFAAAARSIVGLPDRRPGDLSIFSLAAAREGIFRLL